MSEKLYKFSSSISVCAHTQTHPHNKTSTLGLSSYLRPTCKKITSCLENNIKRLHYFATTAKVNGMTRLHLNR